jgi:hypothetical protein
VTRRPHGPAPHVQGNADWQHPQLRDERQQTVIPPEPLDIYQGCTQAAAAYKRVAKTSADREDTSRAATEFAAWQLWRPQQAPAEAPDHRQSPQWSCGQLRCASACVETGGVPRRVVEPRETTSHPRCPGGERKQTVHYACVATVLHVVVCSCGRRDRSGRMTSSSSATAPAMRLQKAVGPSVTASAWRISPPASRRPPAAWVISYLQVAWKRMEPCMHYWQLARALSAMHLLPEHPSVREIRERRSRAIC